MINTDLGPVPFTPLGNGYYRDDTTGRLWFNQLDDGRPFSFSSLVAVNPSTGYDPNAENQERFNLNSSTNLAAFGPSFNSNLNAVNQQMLAAWPERERSFNNGGGFMSGFIEGSDPIQWAATVAGMGYGLNGMGYVPGAEGAATGATGGGMAGDFGQYPMSNYPAGATAAGAGAAGTAGTAAGGAAGGLGSAGSAAAGAAGASLIPGISNSLLGAGLGAALGSQSGARPAGTTVTVQDIPEWQKQLLFPEFANAKNLLHEQVAQGPSPLVTSAQDQLQRTINGEFLNSNPGNETYRAMTQFSNPYESMLLPTANGQYLTPESNPYIRATYDAAARGVTDNYNSVVRPQNDSVFYRAGAFGPGSSTFEETVARNQYGLGQNLNNLATDIYGRNYSFERGNQLNAQNALIGSANTTQGIHAAGAAGLSGNYNTASQQQQAATLAAPAFATAKNSAAWQPYKDFMSIAGGSFGGSQSQPYFNNPMGGALSGAMIGGMLAGGFGGPR
jgi:hypothetical protein